MPDGINSTYEDLLNLTDFKMPSAPVAGGISGGVRQSVEDIHESFKNRINGMQDGVNASSVLPISPSQVDTSGRYPYQRIGENNEELYSQGQGVFSKAFAGVTKGLSLAATTFVQSTLGLVNGVAQAMSDGQLSSFYDNPLNRSLDEFNKNLENQLPNYYSQSEKDANWYSPKYFLSANFLFDGIIKNLGFAAGAVAAGGVYGAALKAIPLTARLFSVGKGAEALAATEEALAAGKASEAFGKIKSLSDKFISGYQSFNPAGRAVISGLGTIGEASFEALQNMNSFRDEKIQDYINKNGFSPIGDDLEEINTSARDVGNFSLGLNSLLLTATNYIQLPKILGSSYAGEKGIIDQVISKTKGMVTNEAGELVKEAPRFGKILGTLNKVRPYVFSTSEAFEEGSQYAIQLGSQNYFDKKYRKKDTDILGIAGEAIGETLTSDEGQKNILMGGLSGAIMMARGNFRENQELNKNTSAAISDINSTRISDFTKSTSDAVKRGVAIQEDREKAVAQGDELEAKDLERDYVVNYLTPRIKYDRFDLVQDDINMYKQAASTQEGFAQLQAEGKAVETDTREKFLERLNRFEQTANNTKSLYQSLNLRYAGLVNKEGEPAYAPEVIDKMVYAASKIADYDERIPALTEEISVGVTDINGVIDEVRANSNEIYKRSLEEIEKLDVLPEVKEDLKIALSDVRELTARRDQFVKEYSDLKNNPQNFIESQAEVDIKSGNIPAQGQKLTIKTKDGEEELEIGTEYVLGKIVKYDKKGNEVYRFPSITIIGRNDDGTIKVQQKDGKILDIPESDLEDYKLGKLSDIRKNPKANYYFNHVNSIFTFNFGKGYSPNGRLEYDNKTKALVFVYKDKKGKIKRMEVTLDQTKAKAGFNQAILRPVGKLSPAQEAAQVEADKFDDSVRIEAKRAARLGIIGELIEDSYDRLNSIIDTVSTKKNELTKIEKDLEALNKKIKETPRTEKGNFKKVVKLAIKSAEKLESLKQSITEEIESLQQEQSEIEFNLPLFEDLAQNVDEMPTSIEDFIEEVEEQRKSLEDIQLNNEIEIEKLTSLLGKVDSALKGAIDLVMDLIGKFEKTYSKVPTNIGDSVFNQFLADNPNFLKLNPFFLEDLQKVNELVAQVEDLDINPNERLISELQQGIKEANDNITDVLKTIRAKDIVLDKFKSAIAAFKENKAYEEKQKSDEAFRKDFFHKQEEIKGESGPTITNPAGEDRSVTIKEDKKKDAAILFSSTSESSEDRDTDPSPASLRKRFFLNNVKNFPNRSNLRTILVTQSNQDVVGLPKFIETINANITTPLKDDNISDVDNGWVVAVYVEQNPKDGSISFVDENGNKIETPTAENMVYSTMPTTSLYQQDGTTPRYRKNQEELAKAYQEAWREKRKALLESNEVNIHTFQVSRGIAIEAEKINGVTPENHIAGTLVPEDILTNELVIEVSEGYVAHQGENIGFPAGRPVIKHGDTLQFANNRLLTAQEQNVILEAIIQLAKQYKNTGEFNRQIISYLQNILYWGKYDQKAEDPKNVGRNQIYVNDKFQLVIGNKDKSFPFTEEGLTANAGAIKSVLGLLYNNINKKTLTSKFDRPFEEITGWEGDKPVVVEWPNYQTYLLSNKLPDGKTARSVESTPLTTTVRSISPNAPLDTNFKQKYASLQALDLKPNIKAQPAAQSTTAQQSTTPAATQSAPASQPTPQTQTGQVEVKFTYKSAGGDINVVFTREGNKLKGMAVDDDFVALYEEEAEQIAKDDSISMEDAEAILDKKIQVEFVKMLQAQAGPATPAQSAPVTQTPPASSYPLAGVYNETITVEGIEVPYSYEIKSAKEKSVSLDASKELIKAVTKKMAKNKALTDEDAYNEIYEEVEVKAKESMKALAAKYVATLSANAKAAAGPDEAAFKPSQKSKNEKASEVPLTSTPAEPDAGEPTPQKKLFRFFEQLFYEAPGKQSGGMRRHWFATDQEMDALTKDSFNFLLKLFDALAPLVGSYKDGTFLDPQTNKPLTTDRQKVSAVVGTFFSGANRPNGLTGDPNNIKPGVVLPDPTQAVADDLIKVFIKQNYEKQEAPTTPAPTGKPQIGGGLGFPQYRRVGADTEFMTSKELEEFKAWMKKNLPLVPFEVLEELIKINPTENAWGVFENGTIKFYKNAAKGTGYHEAFEAVWGGMLSPARQQEILAEFKSKRGTFIDRASGDEMLFSEATDDIAKERIADDFSEYVMGKVSPKTFSQRILQFFKDIINFIKSIGNRSVTQELFAQINKGVFKGELLPSQHIDPQYSRVANLTERESYEAVQDMSARLFEQMFRDNASLFDLDKMPAQEFFDNIKQQYVDSGFFNYLQEDGWNKLTARTKGFLKTLRIEFDEDNVATINSEGVNKNDYMAEAFYLDVKKASPYAIKVLFASLLQTQSNNKNTLSLSLPTPKGSSIGGYMLANFNKTYAFLLDKLVNTPTLSGMLGKFKLAARENSDLILPFVRMKGNIATGNIDYDSLNKYDWRLLVNFFSTFSKQSPIPSVQYGSPEGNYIGGGNIQNAVNSTISEWIENIRSLSKEPKKKENGINLPLISYNKKDKVYFVEKASFNALPIKSVGDQIKLLSLMGITFSEGMYNGLSDADKKVFNESIASIKNYIQKTPAIASLSGNTIGISKPLRRLAALSVQTLAPYQATTYYDVNGKKRQNYVENNSFSTFVNVFNSVETLDELKLALPQLNDVFSTNSLILKKGGQFFNNKGERIKNLNVNYAHGTRVGEDGKGTTVDNLNLADRRIFEINNNVVGDYYILTPADSATEWMMNLGNQLYFDEFNNAASVRTKIVNIFKGYLNDDIALALENRTHLKAVAPKAQQLRFLRDILDDNDIRKIEDAIKAGKPTKEVVDSESVAKAIIEFVESKRDIRKTTLLKDNKIYSTINDKTGIELWQYPDLQTNFTTEENNLNRFAMSEETLDNLLLFTETNYAINNIEFHKLFFGDPYQFDVKGNNLDELKRVKLFGSPRRTIFNMPEFNNFLNRQYNIGLKRGIPGWRNHKDYLETVTLDDIDVIGDSAFSDLPEALRDAYSEVNEADAASWIMDLTYREARQKNGQWGDKADEWMEWEQAYTRRALFAKGEFTDYPQELQTEDNALLEQPRPSYPIEVVKSIVSGVKNDKKSIELIVDKYSQLPLIYSQVEGTKLADLYIKMWKEGIDYAVVKSGRKVGRENLHPVYKDGKFNTDSFNNKIDIPWSAWSILVETSYSEGKNQTRGSQATKLVTLDLMEAGVPLTEEIGQKVRRNQNALDALTTEGYATLLKKLGLVDKGGSFEIVDAQRAYSTITDELLRREASNNFKESLSIEDGKFKYPFEASAAYIQIRNMLYSIVDKSITSPKMNGAPHVQVPATMWESEDRGFAIKTKDGWKKITGEEYEALSDKSKVVLNSSSLKWYSKEEPWMEVMLPHWFKNAYKKEGSMPSDEELIKELNTEEGRKILSGIGFRIPTDALHAIENFRVKGFLPQGMGYTIVVPSEITVKAGSDFDIDKLNTYLKNVYVDANNRLRYVAYKGDKESTLAFYRNAFLEDAEVKILKAEKSIKKNTNLIATIEALESGEVSDKFYDKWSAILNSMMGEEDIESFKDGIREVIEQKNLDIEKLNDADLLEVLMGKFAVKMYKASLENEYFESMQELLELPENFERLLTPTTYGTLPKVADKLKELKGIDDGAIKGKLLDRNYMSSQRHAFIIGKSWVGIAAVHITGHSLKQRAPITIDVTKAPPADKLWLGDGSINLPHNERDGKSSLSELKDKKGNYISDSLASIGNGIVDVAKNPFMLSVFRNKETLSVGLFLKELGVDDYTIGYFLNQPIIDYMYDMAESQGRKGIFSPRFIDSVISFFGSESADTFSTTSLASNIESFYQGKRSDAHDMEQVRILWEYLKYSKMANHNFKFTQASNYDVASFLNGFDIAKKIYKTELAEDNNIITSVQQVLDNSSVGLMAKFLDQSKDALAEFFRYDQANVSDVLMRIMKPFMGDDVFMSADQFQRMGTSVITSFTDYLIQTKARVNTGIYEMMVNGPTSIAQQLALAKTKYPDNLILQNLVSVSSDNEEGSKSIKLKVKTQEAYDDNLYTASLRELKENPETLDLYRNIVRAALLQGSAFSSSNLSTLIPVEDYSAVLSPIINQLEMYQDLHNFVDNKAFQRANWRDNNIVPEVTPAFFEFFIDGPGEEPESYFTSFNFPTIKVLGVQAKERKILYVPLRYQAREAAYQVLKMRKVIPSQKDPNRLVNVVTGGEMTKKAFYDAAKRGDTSFKDYFGYMRVEDADGKPVVVVTKNTKTNEDIHNYVYRQINLWGDRFVKEYYEDGSPSKIDNGTVRTENEISEDAIRTYFAPKAMLQIDENFEEYKNSLEKKDCK